MLRRTPYAVRRSCCRAAFCSAAETAKQRHHEFLVRMYAAAPISGLFNKHELKYEEDGSTTLEFTLEKKHCHTAGSLHVSLTSASSYVVQGVYGRRQMNNYHTQIRTTTHTLPLTHALYTLYTHYIYTLRALDISNYWMMLPFSQHKAKWTITSSLQLPSIFICCARAYLALLLQLVDG